MDVSDEKVPRTDNENYLFSWKSIFSSGHNIPLCYKLNVLWKTNHKKKFFQTKKRIYLKHPKKDDGWINWIMLITNVHEDG